MLNVHGVMQTTDVNSDTFGTSSGDGTAAPPAAAAATAVSE
jgi:hypothetical protein